MYCRDLSNKMQPTNDEKRAETNQKYTASQAQVSKSDVVGIHNENVSRMQFFAYNMQHDFVFWCSYLDMFFFLLNKVQ